VTVSNVPILAGRNRQSDVGVQGFIGRTGHEQQLPLQQVGCYSPPGIRSSPDASSRTRIREFSKVAVRHQTFARSSALDTTRRKLMGWGCYGLRNLTRPIAASWGCEVQRMKQKVTPKYFLPFGRKRAGRDARLCGRRGCRAGGIGDRSRVKGGSSLPMRNSRRFPSRSHQHVSRSHDDDALAAFALLATLSRGFGLFGVLAIRAQRNARDRLRMALGAEPNRFAYGCASVRA